MTSKCSAVLCSRVRHVLQCHSPPRSINRYQRTVKDPDEILPWVGMGRAEIICVVSTDKMTSKCSPVLYSRVRHLLQCHSPPRSINRYQRTGLEFVAICTLQLMSYNRQSNLITCQVVVNCKWQRWPQDNRCFQEIGWFVVRVVVL